MVHFDGAEVVGLNQIVEADAEQFGHNADVFPEHDEVLDAHDVLLVVDVFLFGPHQDVDLVQCQLHVLFLRFYDLDRDRLLVLVVKGLDHFPERPAAQALH